VQCRAREGSVACAAWGCRVCACISSRVHPPHRKLSLVTVHASVHPRWPGSPHTLAAVCTGPRMQSGVSSLYTLPSHQESERCCDGFSRDPPVAVRAWVSRPMKAITPTRLRERRLQRERPQRQRRHVHLGRAHGSPGGSRGVRWTGWWPLTQHLLLRLRSSRRRRRLRA
jgi:hypothetical protein